MGGNGIISKMAVEPRGAVDNPHGARDGSPPILAGGKDSVIRQGLGVAATGVDVQLRGDTFGLQGLIQQDSVFHWDGSVIGSVPEKEGRRVFGDLFLQGNQVQKLFPPGAGQIVDRPLVGIRAAGHYTVA